jgi:hypothetical protein
MLRSLFTGHPDLLNTYAAISLPGVDRESLALRLVTWLADGGGRSKIAAYAPPPALMPLFTVWPDGRPDHEPAALPR